MKSRAILKFDAQNLVPGQMPGGFDVHKTNAPLLLIRLFALFAAPLVTIIAITLPFICNWDLRNVFWESVYGLGYFVVGFVSNSYALNSTVGFVGLILWPLLLMIVIGCSAWRAFSLQKHLGMAIAGLFFAALLVWIPKQEIDSLSASGFPMFWNLVSANF
jgi:hypothetical protein